jgi:copper chaperone CopZ
MENKTLRVKGMFGEHCERAIIDSLSHITGVSNVIVRMREGTISFSYDPKVVSLMSIKDLITDEGYDVVG